MFVNFISALALMLVFEGIMPFISPARWRKLLHKVIQQDEKSIRIIGFISMIVGVIILTIINQIID